MPVDKSLSYYGWIYHKILDPLTAEERRGAADLIPTASSVVDIACGTGQLSQALRKKGCRVLGIDISLRMLRFAESHNRYADVQYRHLDATGLDELADRAFDYATLILLLHELPREKQAQALREALRVARRAVLVDSKAPLPLNANGRAVRLVEATIGRDHHPHFQAFLAGGGIPGVLERSGLAVTVEHRATFSRDCREVFVLSA